MTSYRHAILSKRTLAGLFRAIPESPLPVAEIISLCTDEKNPLDSVIREHFSRIFFTYRNPSPADLTAMILMINAVRSGILKIKLEYVSTDPEIPNEPPVREVRRGRTVESEEHKCMKAWLRKHFSAQNIRIARDEISMLGYEVDVGSLSSKIYVECGDTEPRKVLEFLKASLNIGVLQYDSEEIAWFIGSEEFRDSIRNDFLY